MSGVASVDTPSAEVFTVPAPVGPSCTSVTVMVTTMVALLATSVSGMPAGSVALTVTL